MDISVDGIKGKLCLSPWSNFIENMQIYWKVTFIRIWYTYPKFADISMRFLSNFNTNMSFGIEITKKSRGNLVEISANLGYQDSIISKTSFKKFPSWIPRNFQFLLKPNNTQTPQQKRKYTHEHLTSTSNITRHTFPHPSRCFPWSHATTTSLLAHFFFIVVNPFELDILWSARKEIIIHSFSRSSILIFLSITIDFLYSLFFIT